MHGLVNLAHALAHQRAQAQQRRCPQRIEARESRLRLDDGVEVAPVGDVQSQPAEIRRLEDEPSGHTRQQQAVLDREGHHADRAVAAHRQAAAGLDEKKGRIEPVRERRHQESTGHHVVPARLEHQAAADPIEAALKVGAPRRARRAGRRTAPRPWDARKVRDCEIERSIVYGIHSGAIDGRSGARAVPGTHAAESKHHPLLERKSAGRDRFRDASVLSRRRREVARPKEDHLHRLSLATAA